MIVTGTAQRRRAGTLEHMQPRRGTAGVATVLAVRRDPGGDATVTVARAGRRLSRAARPRDGHEAADGAAKAAAEQRSSQQQIGQL